jgi:hypothetical protein
MKKTFRLHYYVDYTLPPIKPYDLIVDILSENTPTTSLRYFFNYKRPIYDRKGGIQIGLASYGINGYTVEISDDKKTGKIKGDYMATHTFDLNNSRYDVFYSGQIYLQLGLLNIPGIPPQTSIDELMPHKNIINVNFEHVAALYIFKDHIKINHGDNKASLKNAGDYKIKGIKNKYKY